MSENSRGIPLTWAVAPVHELFDVVGGGTPSTDIAEYWHGSIPWITSADIDERHQITPRRFISEQAIKNSATNRVPASSVIVVTRVGLGKVGIAETPICFSQDSQALIFNKDILLPKYVLLYMGTAVQVFKHISRGTTISGVTKKQLNDLEFRLPPPPEQKRIVEEIEKQFTRLDAAVAALKRVQANLKRYRAAVLKAACEGRLVPTEAELARRENRSYEPASVLLDRILAERRSRSQVARNPASNGGSVAARRKGKDEDYPPPDETYLPGLPEGWVWSSLGQLFGIYVGATPSRAKDEYWHGNVSWVSSGEVGFCRIRETREKISNLGLAHASTLLHPAGTVLLGMIGEGKTRGQAAILEIPACNNQNSAAIRVSETPLPSEYVYRFLEGEYEQTRRRGSGGNQPALNKERVKAIPFPLPPLAEIHRIVTEVERSCSLIDQLEYQVGLNMEKAERLRQSILKRAFEGKLVPQDPSDEPASAILERIRAEREVESRGSRKGAKEIGAR